MKPCSENAGKYMVICDIGHSLSPRKICDNLKNSQKFKVIFFEKSNLAWIIFGTKRVIIYESGKIIVNGADDANDAKRIIKQIEKVAGNI